MPTLSLPVYSDGIGKTVQVRFGGYNHTPAASEGEIFDMKNLTSEYYPLLSSRKKRSIVREGDAADFISHDGVKYYFSGNTLITSLGETCTIGDHGGKRSFSIMGKYLVIIPDKLYFDLNERCVKPIEESFTGSIKISDGTYAGEAAKANTITLTTAADAAKFRVGDAVTISGCTVSPENNKTPIIEEIDGAKLIFLENVFTLSGTSVTEANVTIKREMPDMDFITSHDNRMFGCRGDSIFVSKLGDPLVWNAFDGAAGSWQVDVGSAGDFTGCVSYLGYVIFFKEENIYKLYGSKPANFQVMASASLGVKKGSHKSFGVAGEILFYHSRAGIVAYSGGIPQNISAPFGGEIYSEAVGGSDGIRYYVSMRDRSGEYHLFVYDTRSNTWIKEDNTEARSICFDERLYIMTEEGVLFAPHRAEDGETEESAVDYSAIFGDFYNGDPNKKGVSKLQARIELSEGSTATFFIQFDSDGEWRRVWKTLTAKKKQSFYLPIVPRRCDHFKIKIEGSGAFRLYSLAKESYSGSEL